MTVALDSEIVGTGYDPKTGDCSYTIERNGKRWTVTVHEDQFHQYGAIQVSIQQRRTHLANALEAAMRGPDDEAKAAAAKAAAEEKANVASTA